MSCAGLIIASVANGQSPGVFAPVASFITDDPNPQVGDTMDFYDTSTNVPTSWTWTLNGNLYSNDQNPSGLYISSQGAITIGLTVSNFAGSSSCSTTYYPEPTGGGRNPP